MNYKRLKKELYWFYASWKEKGVSYFGHQETPDVEFPSLPMFPQVGRPTKGRQLVTLDNKTLTQAHSYILANCKNCFLIVDRMNEQIDDLDLRALSHGPNSVAFSYHGFNINGVAFLTVESEQNKKVQNSGVMLQSMHDNDDHETTYYGRLTDVISLDYDGRGRIVLFRCDWVNTTSGVKIDPLGFIMIQENGRKPTRIEIFHLSRQSKKKGGALVDDEAIRVEDELNKVVQRHLQDKHEGTQTTEVHEDAFREVFGSEHSGRVRCLGAGVLPSQVFPEQCNQRTIFRHGNLPTSEVTDKLREMEEKMKVMEAQRKAEMEQMRQMHEHQIQNFTNVIQSMISGTAGGSHGPELLPTQLRLHCSIPCGRKDPCPCCARIGNASDDIHDIAMAEDELSDDDMQAGEEEAVITK
ncbi:hypothetical protein ZIOFF_051944 [Zingiber officinale]|uniref:DUF4216 domain-containing protein n=1 Tax=Zingiber officinale TaxID=94328 RepID=A0A8J5KHW7_ZINOF|nr:hypothetical protein ZIOFF_051944 [Zingiber officinale]